MPLAVTAGDAFDVSVGFVNATQLPLSVTATASAVKPLAVDSDSPLSLSLPAEVLLLFAAGPRLRHRIAGS